MPSHPSCPQLPLSCSQLPPDVQCQHLVPRSSVKQLHETWTEQRKLSFLLSSTAVLSKTCAPTPLHSHIKLMNSSLSGSAHSFRSKGPTPYSQLSLELRVPTPIDKRVGPWNRCPGRSGSFKRRGLLQGLVAAGAWPPGDYRSSALPLLLIHTLARRGRMCSA